MTKRCTSCKKEKLLTQFNKDGDGLHYWCKPCHSTRSNLRDKTKLLEWRRKNYWAKRDVHVARLRKYFAKPEVIEQRKQWDLQKRLLHPDKYKARNAVNNGIKSGKVVKKPCEVCQAEKVQAHHEDYSQPLNVNWLCRQHHSELHRYKSILVFARLMFVRAFA